MFYEIVYSGKRRVLIELSESDTHEGLRTYFQLYPEPGIRSLYDQKIESSKLIELPPEVQDRLAELIPAEEGVIL